MPISATHFTPRPHVSASIHDHGIVFLHERDGRVFCANRTGAHIWRGLEQQCSTEHIAERISRQYRVSPAIARAHTEQFISSLVERDLVERNHE